MASYQQTVIADSPVAFWPMQETSGNFVDVIGSLTATINGNVTHISTIGINGLPNGAHFDQQTSTYLSVADTAALRITGDFTLEVWVNPDSLASTNEQIYDKGTQSYTAYIVGSGAPGEVVFAASSVANYCIAPASSVTAGSLYYVVVTRSGNSETIYVNASSVATGASSQAALGNTGTASRIGGTTTGNNPFFGKMAGLAIYNTALTPSQVSSHYAARNSSGGGGPTTKKAPPPGIVGRVPGGPKPHKPPPHPGPTPHPPPAPPPVPPPVTPPTREELIEGERLKNDNGE